MATRKKPPKPPPSWDDMTAEEKMEVVRRENRQLYELLNEQGGRITALEVQLAQIRRALEGKIILLEE